jgi:translation initiation factor IF-2
MLLGIAGTVLAADQRLDDANAHCDQAVALLTAAESAREKPEFGGHRKRAIDLIKSAQREIKAAKEFADRTPGPAPSGSGPRPPYPAPSGSAPKPGPKPGPKPAPSGGHKY